MTDMAQARRERRREDMRNELAEAALQLFEQRGFDEVTVDEIAGAVGVSQRTFFRYFDSKLGVLFADHKERLADLKALLAARPRDEPLLSAVRVAFSQTAERYEGDIAAQMLRRSAIIARSPSLIAFSLALQADWEQVITTWVRERLGRGTENELRARLIGASSMAAMRIALANWLESEGQSSYARQIEKTISMLDGGLNPRPSSPDQARSRAQARPA